MKQGIWGMRASTFLSHGLELPGTSGEENSFWKRFRIYSSTDLYVADSHKFITYSPLTQHHYDQVISYDAHHDSGYDNPIPKFKFSCEDWTHYFMDKGIPVKVVYPKWKEKYAFVDEELETPIQLLERTIDRGESPQQNISAVFLCRSGAWSPSWLDKKFFSFMNDFPGGRRYVMENIMEREFSIEASKNINAQIEEMRRVNGIK